MARTIHIHPLPGRPGHNGETLSELARWLSDLLGYEFAGPGRGGGRQSGAYHVPGYTLLCDQAKALGIIGAGDLFGGVVRHPYMATKSITHRLVGPEAVRPEGWPEDFVSAIDGAVLRGFSAFCRVDAAKAGEILLRQGSIRLKPGSGDGGRGQITVHDATELSRALAGLDKESLHSLGLVIEENLNDPQTLSVGSIAVGDFEASYCGYQHLTRDAAGAPVYGGSDLQVVRGGFEALKRADFPPREKQAIQKAHIYHEAAGRYLDGFIASRSNYDVIAGEDAAGTPRMGVLEQSWRLGGASGAELMALAALVGDPGPVRVRASCWERYGEAVSVPPDGRVYYSGDDGTGGLLRKWARLEDIRDAYKAD